MPFSDLRASLSGVDVPEHIKTKLFGMQEENVAMKEALKVSQDKLQKAKQVYWRYPPVFLSLS